ncbi:MAG TPA: sulfotransferase [Devosia sp.]|jgi:hypothetical protein|nr:sulfotransferase [Devosia sp.]
MIGASHSRRTPFDRSAGGADPKIMRSLALIGGPRVAFICGCGHSGTTILATILSAHPEIHVPLRESEVFLRRPVNRFRHLLRLRRETSRAGKSYLVEKTPRHIRKLELIRRLVPDARLVILVRDGRDVTSSIGRRENGDLAAGFARWVADTGIAMDQRGKPDSHIVRYEDLVADPGEAIQALCGFLGVPYAATMLDYHAQPRLWYGQKQIERGSGVGTGGQHEKLRNWQVNQPIFDGRGRWKAELPPDYVARFEQGRAREIMDAFGYALD